MTQPALWDTTFYRWKKITIATDIGHITDELVGWLEKSHFILLESNHDVEMLKTGRYPWPLKKRIMGDYGHLCNDHTGRIVAHLAETVQNSFCWVT